ncbi:hypothetical protein [Aquimarina algiphila]|uniref:Uncharacterized protein n=1 Tax=Aquimarina algiphila TaxID=2047982 RepID=A0A554VRR2_9FLAO|nr:hypothetical protein [Aquimarina algiphila]TSE11321.1 hypothetical protein FOF46_01440 [Aquimarina algiphila]
MRNLLVVAVLFITSLATAQFDPNTGTNTGEVFTVDSVSREVWQTSKGTKYLFCINPENNNPYAVWLFTATNEKDEDGRLKYISKKGSKCVYKIGKSGNPYPNWDKKEKKKVIANN